MEVKTHEGDRELGDSWFKLCLIHFSSSESSLFSYPSGKWKWLWDSFLPKSEWLRWRKQKTQMLERMWKPSSTVSGSHYENQCSSSSETRKISTMWLNCTTHEHTPKEFFYPVQTHMLTYFHGFFFHNTWEQSVGSPNWWMYNINLVPIHNKIFSGTRKNEIWK